MTGTNFLTALYEKLRRLKQGEMSNSLIPSLKLDVGVLPDIAVAFWKCEVLSELKV